MNKKIIINKIDTLKERIEDWASINGYDNVENAEERKDDDGDIIWQRTDWEYVDDTHNLMINDKDFYPHASCFKKMNVLWKKYYIAEKIGDSY